MMVVIIKIKKVFSNTERDESLCFHFFSILLMCCFFQICWIFCPD